MSNIQLSEESEILPSNLPTYCSIPYGNQLLCPVKALEQWLAHAKINEGPVFRRLTQNTYIGSTALTPLSVNHILKRCAKAADISMHNNSARIVYDAG
jgi:hypothetical protein